MSLIPTAMEADEDAVNAAMNAADKEYPPGNPAGVDEAGRGSWAGPLVVAAVVLPSDV